MRLNEKGIHTVKGEERQTYCEWRVFGQVISNFSFAVLKNVNYTSR